MRYLKISYNYLLPYPKIACRRKKELQINYDEHRNITYTKISLRVYLFIMFFVIAVADISQSQKLTWIRVNSNPGDDIEVVNDSSVFACTGTLLYSSDRGDHWISMYPNPQGVSITYIAINDSTNSIFAYSAYNDWLIYKSTDNGNSWKVTLNRTRELSDLISFKGNVYAINYLGTFYKTTDDGETWDSTYVDYGLLSMAVAPSGQIYIGTFYDKIFTSENLGASWYHLDDETLDTHVNSIAINNNGEIFATHKNGITTSKDSGKTWNFFSAPIDLGFESTLAVDEQNNLYAGAYGGIIKSTNEGEDWSNLGGKFNSVRRIKVHKNIIYIASSNGIFKHDPLAHVYVGSQYFPMHVGNRWQYFSSSSIQDIQSYSCYHFNIDKDTLINRHKYFKYLNSWMRYSEEKKQLFKFWKDSDRVVMDFNLPETALFQQFLSSSYQEATITAGSMNIFGTQVKYKGSSGGDSWAGGIRIENYAEKFGPIQFITERYGPGPDIYGSDDLIEAILYDSTGLPKYYTNHNKPNITLTPINKISNSLFKLVFNVDHKYSRFFDSSTPNNGINFIDSVFMLSYYSYSDSIINNESITADNIQGTDKYIIAAKLDTMLLERGFIFNYKISAKDKGIIPEYSNLPDTGFFNCSWDENTSINEIEKTKMYFKLEQNYPNPFNPTTTISYSIPKKSFVTIKVYNLLGKEIAVLVNEEKLKGDYKIKFNVVPFSSGVYFYKMTAGNFTHTKKLIILK